MEKTLPKGWRWARLGEVCGKNTGTRNPAEITGGFFEYIDISSINNISGVIEASQTIANKDAPSRARKIVQTNDVLVSTVRPNLNAVAIVPKNLDNQICSTGFCVLRPYPEISDYRYIYFLTRSKHFVESLTKKTQGASYPAVSDKDIFRFQIPLPPLPTQRKIVEILEEADSLRKLRRQADERMKDLIPSLFVEMFGDPTTNPKGWEKKKLGEVCYVTKLAGFEFTKYIKYADKGEIIALRGINIKDGHLDLTDIKRIRKEISDSLQRSKVNKGDILMTFVGSLGSVAVAPKSDTFHLGPNVCKIKIESSQINIHYLFSFLKYFAIKQIALLSKITSMGSISMQNIRQILIPLSPLPLQQEFAERVKKIEAEKERQAESKKRLDDLFNSLMQRAFKGELVA